MSADQRIDTTWGPLLAEQIKANGRLFFRLAFGILRNSSAAEDACQQAFSKAWERRGEIDGPEALRPWLAKVVINESLATVRRGKVEKRILATRAEEDVSMAVAPGTESEARESVVTALERLPETPRLVVTLRIMQGMSGKEVKALLGCSDSEVSRQLYLGMERLRTLLSH